MIFDNDAASKYLMFVVNERLFSIEMSSIEVIIKAQPPLPIPEYPDYVLGTVTLDGKILPVIDSRVRFGYPQKELNDRSCIIVCRCDGKMAGLTADSVLDFKDVEDEKLLPPPNLNNDACSRYLSGAFITHDGSTCYILSPFKMFNECDEHILDEL